MSLLEKIHIKQWKIGELSVREFSEIFCANQEKLHLSMRNNQLKTFLISVFINNFNHC